MDLKPHLGRGEQGAQLGLVGFVTQLSVDGQSFGQARQTQTVARLDCGQDRRPLGVGGKGTLKGQIASIQTDFHPSHLRDLATAHPKLSDDTRRRRRSLVDFQPTQVGIGEQRGQRHALFSRSQTAAYTQCLVLLAELQGRGALALGLLCVLLDIQQVSALGLGQGNTCQAQQAFIVLRTGGQHLLDFGRSVIDGWEAAVQDLGVGTGRAKAESRLWSQDRRMAQQGLGHLALALVARKET